MMGTTVTKSGSIINAIKEFGNDHFTELITDLKLPKMVDITESTPIIREAPSIRYFTHRKISQKTEMADREKYMTSYKKYLEWAEAKKLREANFCIKDPRSKEEQTEAAKIQSLIYSQRKSKEKAPDIDEDGMLLNDFFKDNDQTEEFTDPLLELLRKQGNSKGPRVYKERLIQQVINQSNVLSVSGAQPINRENKKSAKPKANDDLTLFSETLPNYFKSNTGKEFLSKNPPDKEEDVKRNTWAEKKKMAEIIPEEAERPKESKEEEEEKNNPIVVLQTEVTTQKQKKPTEITASKYSQTIKQMVQEDHEKFLQAEQYHVTKTKEFDIIGKPREIKPLVSVIQRPNISKDLNQKYIMIDMLTDKRIKTTSMANRILIKAPDVEVLRKKGQHQMVESAIKKRQTYEELMMENNAMIEYTLSDPTKRNILITPPAVRFGTLKRGLAYQTKLIAKNEDVMPQRIFIKNCKVVSVHNMRPGPV